MLFNSYEFLLFLIIVFAVYWLLNGKTKIQNGLLLISSYFFYSAWDHRFLLLLMFSTILDFYTGEKIFDSESVSSKRKWLIISVGINLSILGLFKYYNFFTDSFIQLVNKFGLNLHPLIIELILPIGISFYTFHGLSYVLDIYNGKAKPTPSFVNYSLFVSFFPLLVAGPIERATHLLPQIENERVFRYTKAIDGLRQILWGLFKKIVIADNCAKYANLIFSNYQEHDASTLVLGAIYFSFQIYGDFSGYSDIALGVARLFGFELLKNFSFPYFSRNIAEFWRRWHISLSSWFRDYLYIPLGGGRGSKWQKVRNTFIIFLVSGFWHGANWTFVIWGALHAFYILPSIFKTSSKTEPEIVAQGKALPSIKDIIDVGSTFTLTVFAWIFFRANNVSVAFDYIKRMLSISLFRKPELLSYGLVGIIAMFIIIEWVGREDNYAIEKLAFKKSRTLRWLFYYSILLIIFLYSGQEQEFIYFQF